MYLHLSKPVNEVSDKIMGTEKKNITPLSDQEINDVNGGITSHELQAKFRVLVREPAALLLNRDIASRAAKERCDVLFGLNASGTPEIPE